MSVQRGVCVEICYSGAIRDPSQRVNILASSLSLVLAVSGKGIVFGSCAEKCFDVRSPLDVRNMAQIFRISKSKSKICISENPKQVLKHAFSRKTVLGVVIGVHSDQLDVWKRTKSYQYSLIEQDSPSDEHISQSKRLKIE
ncbi:ribonuclease P protein subunit p30-like [Octopus sinensis]|nr:ribonuclease P protein subunit p30-like [Octopus sinensis]XP_036355427.1 ribonuclease P protein subunit p30-like [Octopus sinensis]